MRIAILGAGRVGKALGPALQARGHSVVYGVREPKPLTPQPLSRAPAGGLATKTIGGAIAAADAVILAIPWTAAEALVCEHEPALAGKTVIDATNPLNTSETRLALGFDTSGVELLQSHAHGATFFKAFNVAGFNAIARPRYPQGVAAGLVAGPRGPQKDLVMGLVADIGLEPVDAGELRAARLLEPLGMLILQLEETQGGGRDIAFVLGAREPMRVEPIRPNGVAKLETLEAG
ncbi:MAG TPA: NAD(P)-binding domain-containing protein [Methyloceanibacter sp.]|nr:NAD(P)-binding domain-containing protein [Methyloceanibacter sp.]